MFAILLDRAPFSPNQLAADCRRLDVPFAGWYGACVRSYFITDDIFQPHKRSLNDPSLGQYHKRMELIRLTCTVASTRSITASAKDWPV